MDDKIGKLARFSGALICVGILSACGGGGGGGTGAPPQAPSIPTSPPAAPVATLSISTKLLRFDWATVPGASSYRLAANYDGMSGFEPVGAALAANATSTSLEVAVHLADWLNARYQIQACNAAGCTSSADLSAMTGYQQATGYFKASNPGQGDSFGVAIALSRDGNTLAVGASYEDSAAQGVGGNQSDDTAAGSGAVYVFVRSASSIWTQQAYLKAGNAEANDGFGDSVAISGDGNTIVVGATGEDSVATGVNGDALDNSTGESGASYVFTRNGNNWSQQAYLKASNTEAGDFFGHNVAMSADGNTAAVSAIGEDSSADGIDGLQTGNSASAAGAVYLFTRSGINWSQTAYVKSSFSGAGHFFGGSLSLDASGQVLVVGATGEGSGATGVDGPQSNNNRPNSGAAYVFRYQGGAWSQQSYLKASRATSGIRFGTDVAVSGDGSTIAVSASREGSNATGIGGDQDAGGAADAGAVYVFVADGETWQQEAYIKAFNTDAGDYFGYALALNDNGNLLAVGAVFEASLASGINGDQLDNAAIDTGAVYFYTRAANIGLWIPRNYLKPNHPSPGDYFGISVALSGDGFTLAVGSDDDSASSGLNGNANDDTMTSAGAVHLY